MEDYQQWRRRELNAEKLKKKPEYRFFPNRTPFQTYAATVLVGITCIAVSYGLSEFYLRKFANNSKKWEYEYRLVRTHIPEENAAIMWRKGDRVLLDTKRYILRLPEQPSSTALISDPALKYPEPRGQLTL